MTSKKFSTTSRVRSALLAAMLTTLSSLTGCGGSATQQATTITKPMPVMEEPKTRTIQRDASNVLMPSSTDGGRGPASPSKETAENASPAPRQMGVLPAIPQGARFTLFVDRLEGASGGVGHIERAEKLKVKLMETSGLRDWYVVHEANASLIYHGFYLEIDDSVADKASRQSAAKAKAERNRVESLRAPGGTRPFFPRAIMVRLDSPDPDAPPEWNLANSPGYWTVQIGVYFGSPERKRVAVDAVREARKMGLDAYYYHGENVSSVCLGSFSIEAVEEKAVQIGSDSETASVVVSNMPVPDEVANLKDSQGNPMQVRKTLTTIHEPQIKQILKSFPYHSVNGEVDIQTSKDSKTQQTKQIERPPLIVRIPRGERTPDSDGTQSVPQLVDPTGRQTQNVGTRLKTIGQ